MPSKNPGQKYVVIPPDVYQSMKDRVKVTGGDGGSSNIMQPPEKTAMLKVEEKMSGIWERKDLSGEEKVRLSTQFLNDFKSHYNTLTTSKPLELYFTAAAAAAVIGQHLL